MGAPLENLAGRIPICSGIRTTKGGCVTAIGVLPLWPVRNSNVAFPRVNLDGCVILTSIRVCTMSLGPKEFHKPVKVLRKLLKNFQERPLPEPVHRLRRYTRRLESMLQALMLDRRRNERRLLEAIARLRKRAGKVRDIDVLVGLVCILRASGENECRIQLLEHLGALRFRRARKLYNLVQIDGPVMQRRLKRCLRHIDQALAGCGKKNQGSNFERFGERELNDLRANFRST